MAASDDAREVTEQDYDSDDEVEAGPATPQATNRDEIRQRLALEHAAIARQASISMEPYEYKGDVVCYRKDYWRRSTKGRRGCPIQACLPPGHCIPGHCLPELIGGQV